MITFPNSSSLHFPSENTDTVSQLCTSLTLLDDRERGGGEGGRDRERVREGVREGGREGGREREEQADK